MTNDDRARIEYDLADARNRRAWAVYRINNAKSRRDRQMAQEDAEFYGNRAAFLQSWLNKP